MFLVHLLQQLECCIVQLQPLFHPFGFTFISEASMLQSTWHTHKIYDLGPVESIPKLCEHIRSSDNPTTSHISITQQFNQANFCFFALLLLLLLMKSVACELASLSLRFLEASYCCIFCFSFEAKADAEDAEEDETTVDESSPLAENIIVAHEVENSSEAGFAYVFSRLNRPIICKLISLQVTI